MYTFLLKKKKPQKEQKKTKNKNWLSDNFNLVVIMGCCSTSNILILNIVTLFTIVIYGY